MKKPKKPKTYQELKDVWYKKLEAAGFVDIEEDEDKLKEYSYRFARVGRDFMRQDKDTYYSMASNFLNDFRFKNNFEKIIWEYHSNGLSVRSIESTLSKARIKRGHSKSEISVIIVRLTQEMKKLYRVRT